MTALQQYQRLEAAGLWRAAPGDTPREVVVSVGEATLTISTFENRALTHWSLAAIERRNPGEFPALYGPDGDPGETLQLAKSETEMIAAIETLRVAVERARPPRGRVRVAGLAVVGALLIALGVGWLPGALTRHAVNVVPDIQRQAIGKDLLARIERRTGAACASPEARPALARLARRMGVRQLVVLPGEAPAALYLPGGTVALGRSLIESQDDPAAVAGYILAERTRATRRDPLARLLEAAGPLAALRLLTSGALAPETLDAYAENLLASPSAPAADAGLLAAFRAAELPSTPYARARGGGEESLRLLIDADPMTGQAPPPVLRDRDWIRLQGVCAD